MSDQFQNPPRPSVERPVTLHRRRRKTLNCNHCRQSKLRCDRQYPCSTCKRRHRSAECSYSPNERDSVAYQTPSLTAPPSVHGAHASPSEPDSRLGISSEPLPFPGGQEPADDRWDAALQRPVLDQYDFIPTPDILSPFSIGGPNVSRRELLTMLPPRSCTDYLVSHYFTYLSPLFHILHGPTFQKEYATFMKDPSSVDLSWLALLFAICSLTLSAIEPSDPGLADLWPKKSPGPLSQGDDVTNLSGGLRRASMICLSLDHFFVRHKLSTLETLLITIYAISHSNGADRGWALLGMTLNIAIALRCNVDEPNNMNFIELERRRRCWASILTLHTYQAILYRDVNMSFLLDIKATMPADVNDTDMDERGPLKSSTSPTQMSLMIFKVSVFRLSTKICSHIAGPSRLDKALLKEFDDAIAQEQIAWDQTFLVDGQPSLLDNTYAYWCILQTYAHQLYLLLHRPFYLTRSDHFLPASRDRYITSSMALIDLHQKFYQLPILKHHHWLITGVITSHALYGAVGLTSAILDMPDAPSSSSYRTELDKLLCRMETLSNRSPVCSKAYQVIRHLESQLHPKGLQQPEPGGPFESPFVDWSTISEWFNADFIPENIDGFF